MTDRVTLTFILHFALCISVACHPSAVAPRFLIMIKVVALGIDFHLSDEAISALREVGATVVHTSGADIEELALLTRDADAVMASLVKVPAPVIAQMEQCRLLAAIGVGYDHIDFRAAKERGIPVTHVPDY